MTPRPGFDMKSAVAKHLVWIFLLFLLPAAAQEESLAALGTAYRSVMGRHFPAMTLVEVRRLVEPEALVEIEATAVLPREVDAGRCG